MSSARVRRRMMMTILRSFDKEFESTFEKSIIKLLQEKGFTVEKVKPEKKTCLTCEFWYKGDESEECGDCDSASNWRSELCSEES